LFLGVFVKNLFKLFVISLLLLGNPFSISEAQELEIQKQSSWITQKNLGYGLLAAAVSGAGYKWFKTKKSSAVDRINYKGTKKVLKNNPNKKSDHCMWLSGKNLALVAAAGMGLVVTSGYENTSLHFSDSFESISVDQAGQMFEGLMGHLETDSNVFDVFLSGNQVLKILKTAIEIKKEGNPVNHNALILPPPLSTESSLYCLTGDIHGSSEALVKNYNAQIHAKLVSRQGVLSNDVSWIQTGDIADRGPNGIECWMLILLSMIQNPEKVIIIRGNHEEIETAYNYGFFGNNLTGAQGEIDEKYPQQSQEIKDLFSELFELLPDVVFFGNPDKRIMAVHGALPLNAQEHKPFIPNNLKQALIDNKEGFIEIPDDFGWRWSQFDCENKVVFNKERGCGYKFGYDLVKPVLQEAGIVALFSGHVHYKTGPVAGIGDTKIATKVKHYLPAVGQAPEFHILTSSGCSQGFHLGMPNGFALVQCKDVEASPFISVET
jgi:hypothetical protein